MNYLDIGKILYEFEVDRFDAYKDQKIGNWNSWAILRRPLYYFIFNNKLKNGTVSSTETTQVRSGYNLKKRTQDFLSFQYSFFKKALFKPKKDLALLMPMSIGKVYKDENGKFVDILIDPFVKYGAVKNYLYLEISDAGKFIRPASIEPDLLGDGLQLPIMLQKAYLLKTKAFTDLSFFYESVLNSYFKEKGLSFTLQAEEIRQLFVQYYAELSVYKTFFSLLKPKFAIFNDELFSGRMTAAIEAGVKTAELQHGFIGNYKPDYFLSGKLNAIRKDLPLCTKLATFGEFHNENITYPGFWREDEVMNIGNFRIDLSRTRVQKGINEKFVILFPTQWHVFEESKNLLNSLKAYIATKDIQLVMKAHPREPKENLEWYSTFAACGESNINFYVTEFDIYNLIQKADLVIGFDSTTLLESVAIGVPTITLATPTLPKGIHSYLWTDKLENVIRIANDENQAVEMAERLQTDKVYQQVWDSEVKEQGEYLYANHYEQNIKNLVEALSK